MVEQLLEGRTAIVAGGSRGIGAAIAFGLARAGSDVVITHSRAGEAPGRTVEEIEALGRRAVAVHVDSRDRTGVHAMVEGVVDTFGRIDILVNNAGTMQRMPFLETTDEAWRDMYSVNVDGLFVVGQEVARAMIAGGGPGAIVSITSVAQRQVAPNMTAYNSSKAAAFRLTQQMAYELAPHHIRVNCVAPGLTETDLNRHDLAVTTFRSQRIERIPLGYIGEPEDQVAAVVYLASDESRYVTGACLEIDGGASLTGPPAMMRP